MQIVDNVRRVVRIGAWTTELESCAIDPKKSGYACCSNLTFVCFRHRKLVMETIRDCGLKDPHNYLPKELDSWDVWNLDDSDRGTELRNISRNWLDK